jgi:hypothetical protein
VDGECIGVVRNAFKISVGKKPHGRTGSRWNDITVDLKSSVNMWIVVWGAVAGSCEHGNKSSGSIKAKNFLSS